jgi:hypothetical protein
MGCDAVTRDVPKFGYLRSSLLAYLLMTDDAGQESRPQESMGPCILGL